MTLGLWDETPDADLAASREAFARGDLSVATSAADEAAATWSGAAGLGRGRAISLAVLAASLLIAIALVVIWMRGRRRRRIHRMQAHRIKT